ncbi:MAG: DUF378 domain-containing protein [Anaerovoracaceae bacterium]
MIMKKIILLLLIIGGLNWGLVGIFDYNLVSSVFSGNLAIIARVIYIVVGLAAIWAITFLFDNKREG